MSLDVCAESHQVSADRQSGLSVLESARRVLDSVLKIVRFSPLYRSILLSDDHEFGAIRLESDGSISLLV